MKHQSKKMTAADGYEAAMPAPKGPTLKHQHINMTHADRHDAQMKALDQRDHLTKKAGGTATHGVNYTTAQSASLHRAINQRVDNGPVSGKPKRTAPEP